MSQSEKHHLFVLNPGYVESTRLSVMIVHHADGFDSPLEAMEHFRQVLINYVSPPERQLTECCQETANEYPNATYCHDCGSRIKRVELEPRMLNARVAEAFDSLTAMDLDSYSDCGLCELFEEAGWELSGDCFHLAKYPFVFVWHLYHWMQEGGGRKPYLEWHFPGMKSGNNRE